MLIVSGGPGQLSDRASGSARRQATKFRQSRRPFTSQAHRDSAHESSFNPHRGERGQLAGGQCWADARAPRRSCRPLLRPSSAESRMRPSASKCLAHLQQGGQVSSLVSPRRPAELPGCARDRIAATRHAVATGHAVARCGQVVGMDVVGEHVVLFRRSSGAPRQQTRSRGSPPGTVELGVDAGHAQHAGLDCSARSRAAAVRRRSRVGRPRHRNAVARRRVAGRTGDTARASPRRKRAPPTTHRRKCSPTAAGAGIDQAPRQRAMQARARHGPGVQQWRACAGRARRSAAAARRQVQHHAVQPASGQAAERLAGASSKGARPPAPRAIRRTRGHAAAHKAFVRLAIVSASTRQRRAAGIVERQPPAAADVTAADDQQHTWACRMQRKAGHSQ